MEFLVPNYRCLQNPWLGGYHTPDPCSVLCPQLNLLNPTPKKIPGYATEQNIQELITMKLGRVRVLSLTLENALHNTSLWLKKLLALLSTMFRWREWNLPFILWESQKKGEELNFFFYTYMLSLHKTQPTSAARAKCFTQENVLKFFSISEPWLFSSVWSVRS